MIRLATLALAGALTACTGASDDASVNAADLTRNPDLQIVHTDAIPPPIRRLAEQVAPGIDIQQVEQKEHRGDVIIYHVRGPGDDIDTVSVDIRDDGGTLDKLGRLTAVAVTRPIDWAKTPAEVQAAVKARPNAFAPARVNARRELADGAMVYELFTPDRARGLDAPSMTVRVKDRTITVTDRRRAI